MTGRALRVIGGIALAIGSVALATAPAGAAERGSDTITVDEVPSTGLQHWAFTGVDSSYAVGKYVFTLDNQSAAPHEFVAFKLTDQAAGLTIDQLRAAADAHDDSVIDRFAGAEFAPPGAQDTGKFKLKEAGTYAYFCFIDPTDDGNPADAHYNRGLVGKFTVTD